VNVDCEHVQSLLSAYVDRELDLVKSLEVEAHTRECSRCEAALQQLQTLRTAIGGGTLAFATPAGLEARVRGAIRPQSRPRPRHVSPWWRWASVPLAATLAAAISWNVATRHGGSDDDRLLAELVSGHIRSLMVDHLVDVATSDQHVVKPWFNGKVDFAPPVEDFNASGFPLIGGRVDYIDGRPVAVLVYKRRQHVMNVFIWPSGSGPTREEASSLELQGYHLLHWSRGGLTFWAVSDVNSSELENLAHLIQETG